jgi:serine/threonine protein kinase
LQLQVINPLYSTARDECFSTEVNIMRRLSHHNLFVRVFGSITGTSGHALQWCECGMRIVVPGSKVSRCKKNCKTLNDWPLTDRNTIVMGKAVFAHLCFRHQRVHITHSPLAELLEGGTLQEAFEKSPKTIEKTETDLRKLKFLIQISEGKQEQSAAPLFMRMPCHVLSLWLLMPRAALRSMHDLDIVHRGAPCLVVCPSPTVPFIA